MPPIVRRRKLNALPMSEADRQRAITPDASSCCGSQAQGEKAGGTNLQGRRPTSQYVRLFSGLRRSTSREYLVLLADDQMPDRTAATEGRLWRGHSRPAQPHGNFDLDRG